MEKKNEITKQIPQKPTGALAERIERLNREFKPLAITVFLSPSKDLNYEELFEEYVEWIENLEAFIKNGHSCEGLWFKFEEVYKV